MVGLLGLFGRQPVVVFWEPLPRDSAGFQQVAPQSFMLEIEFAAHKQLTCDLDSFLGELAQKGMSEVTANILVLFLSKQFKACFDGQVGVDCLQWAGGVAAKMSFGGGKPFGNG